MTEIRISVSREIRNILEESGKKLGKKASTFARELMEQKMYDLGLIQEALKK